MLKLVLHQVSLRLGKVNSAKNNLYIEAKRIPFLFVCKKNYSSQKAIHTLLVDFNSGGIVLNRRVGLGILPSPQNQTTCS